MERIVRAVRVEEARATRISRGVGLFKRERRESIGRGKRVLQKIFEVKRGV
jgi:hypothetical protein